MRTTLESFMSAINYLQRKNIYLDIKYGTNSYLTYGDQLYIFGEQIGIYLVVRQQTFEIVQGKISKQFFINHGMRASCGIETL